MLKLKCPYRKQCDATQVCINTYVYLYCSLLTPDYYSKVVHPLLALLPRSSFRLHDQKTALVVYQEALGQPMAAGAVRKQVPHNIAGAVKSQVAGGWTYPLDNGRAHCVAVG